MKEREAKIKEYMRDIEAMQAVQAPTFDELGRIQARRYKAEDALAVIDDLLLAIEDGRGTFVRCFMKVCDVLPPKRWPEGPDYVNPEIITSDPVQDPRWDNKGSGRALRYLNPRLKHASSMLEQIPTLTESETGTLVTEQTKVAPGEEIPVHFTAPMCWPDDAWLGIVPSSVPHGDAEVNEDGVLIGTYHSLRGRREGTITLVAPDEPGTYNVRLHSSSQDGNEAAFVTIEVSRTKVANACGDSTVADVLREGERGEPYSRQAGPSAFFESQRDRALHLEGNWYVEWSGTEEDDVHGAMATFVKGLDFKYKGDSERQGRAFQLVRNPDDDWEGEGTGYTIAADGKRKWTQSLIDRLQINPFGGIEIDYFTGIFGGGALGGVERLQQFGRDVMQGRWNRRNQDTGGTSKWRRATPTIEQAIFRYQTEAGEASSAAQVGGGPPEVRLRTWSSGRLRDQSFSIEIRGKELWGVHYPWISSESGELVPGGYAYLCADGELTPRFDFRSWVNCQLKHGGVSGLRFNLDVPTDVEPGRKVFYLDGVAIPFELVIDGRQTSSSEGKN